MNVLVSDLILFPWIDYLSDIVQFAFSICIFFLLSLPSSIALSPLVRIILVLFGNALNTCLRINFHDGIQVILHTIASCALPLALRVIARY